MSKIRSLVLIALVTASFALAGCSGLCSDPCDQPDCCDPCGCN